MNIAHSLYYWLPGTMTWIYNQLKYLPDAHSMVLTERMLNRDLFPWSPLYEAESLENAAVYKILQLARRMGSQWHPRSHHAAVRRYKPDILHSHFGDRGWYDIAFAKKYSMTHVVTFYGYDLSMLPVMRPYWKKRYEQLFDHADCFLCEGPFMAQSLTALGCPEEKITVQKLGIELGRIPYRPRTIGKDDIYKILIAGSFREKKGIPIALKAVASLYKDYRNIQVTVIGDATARRPDQEEKKRIIQVIRDNILEDVVNLRGFQPYEELIKEFYRNHVFLSPSVTASDNDTEGGAPVTIIEASASGMPIVSTTHCDIPDVVCHDETGILVPERDAHALTEALKKLLSDPEKLTEMGKNGSVFIAQNHSVKKQALRLKAVYRELMSG